MFTEPYVLYLMSYILYLISYVLYLISYVLQPFSLRYKSKIKQYNNSQHDSIPAEYLEIMPLDVSHQES